MSYAKSTFMFKQPNDIIGALESIIRQIKDGTLDCHYMTDRHDGDGARTIALIGKSR